MAHDEILVAPVVKEEVRHGRFVRVNHVHAQLPQREVRRGALRRFPEADGLPGGVDGGNGPLHGVQLGVNHPALAVPLAGEVPEAAAYHGNLLQLPLRVSDRPVRADFAVEPDAGGVIGKVLRLRTVSGNDHFYAAGAVKHVGEGLHQRHHARQGIDAFKVYQQLKLFVAVFPHAAAVLPEQPDDGQDVHFPEAAGGLEVFPVVGHQNFAVLFKDIGLDGAAVLGIGLPEGGRAVIVVVRMENDGKLGGSAKGQQERQEQKKFFHYL